MKKLTEVLTTTLHMGGYGGYVWPSFALAALIMLAMAALSLRALKRAQAALPPHSAARDEA